MCGRDKVAPALLRSSFGRAEAQRGDAEGLVSQAEKAAAGSSGRSPGNSPTSAVPSKVRPPSALAGDGGADDRGEPLARFGNGGLARGTHGGHGGHVHRGARKGRPLTRFGHQMGKDRLQSVVVGVMDVVRLGRDEEDLVDPPVQQRAEEGQHAPCGSRRARQPARGGARPSPRGRRSAPPERPPERSAGRAGQSARERRGARRAPDTRYSAAPSWPTGYRPPRPRRGSERREGERGRSLKVARHEKATRRQRGERVGIAAHRRKVGGERCGKLAGHGFARPRIGIGGLHTGQERASLGGAPARFAQGLGGPLGKRLVHERQVEQPFAGIVHQIQMQPSGTEPAAQKACALVLQRDAQLSDAMRGGGPVPLLHQRAHMVLVGKARHLIVRLRRQLGLGEPAFSIGRKERQAAPVHQVVHQSGQKHRLAGARQPGHAKAHGRRDDARQALGKRGRAGPRFILPLPQCSIAHSKPVAL